MAGRKKKPEEHVNHERWLVSYADFITLLFAFFVVMYAVSSVNAGKYRVLSSSLLQAFRSTSRSLQPIQVGKLNHSRDNAQSKLKMPQHLLRPPYPSFPDPIRSLRTHDASMGSFQANHIRAVSERIERALHQLIEKKLVVVRHNSSWVEVNINTSVLFASASTTLSGQASGIIERIADILKAFPDRINVEGFTDNQPIKTSAFPSNWELSAARAASVVHRLTAAGIAPERLAAIGYGRYHPVAENATAAGRARNRRVALVIMTAATDERGTPPFDHSMQVAPRVAAP